MPWLENCGSLAYGISDVDIIRAELHIHTVLSPCAEIEMIPPLIVQEAVSRGIKLIAITDHNASANAWAVMEAARDTGVTVLPGMEVQTREEVHLLCLFDTLEQTEAWQKIVDASLPYLENDPGYFGEQFVVDETGDYIRSEERLLATATTLSFEQAVSAVERLEGLSVPAHVDRKAFGLIGVLGFVPTGVKLEALELSRHVHPTEAVKKFPQLMGFPLIQNGDVHRLDEFMGVNELTVEAATIPEIRLALNNLEGRSYRTLGERKS